MTPPAAAPRPPASPERTMAWDGWGDPARKPSLPAAAVELLGPVLGWAPTSTPAVPLEQVVVSPSQLSAVARRALDEAVGAAHVHDDHLSRVLHAGGKSYPDLVRRRAGDAAGAPDAVVLPATHDEVVAVLRACVEHQVAVVPFGGGTSVVGGVEPLRGRFSAVVALDLSRMDALLSVDRESLLATFHPGVRGPAAEALLAQHGLTLAHFPQSHEHASIGGYVATRSAGQASTGFGRIDEKVVRVRCATPAGDLDLGRAPASAAGPRLLDLVVGSEGTLAVITEATLRVHERPETTRYEGWAFPDFAAGVRALRALEQSGAAPDVCRLSDEEETRTSLALAGVTGWKAAALERYLRARRVSGGCLVITGWAGSEGAVARRRSTSASVLRDHGGAGLGPLLGRAWEHGRYSGPYLRDTLLDNGLMVETLETATTWSGLHQLHAAVRRALLESMAERGTPAVVLCHVSHLYAAGASLYFTWLARRDTTAPLEQWAAAKAAASRAIVAQGATITHHHAVGTDHQPYLVDEVGELGLEALRAVKAALDPAGVLNPGKLLG